MQYFRGADTLYIMEYAVFYFRGVDTLNIMEYAVFSGWILFIRCITRYFRGVDTLYTMDYEVFSGDGYYLYPALRSISWGQYLSVLVYTV